MNCKKLKHTWKNGCEQLKIKLDIHNSQERKFKYFNGNFSLECLLSLDIYIYNILGIVAP